MTTNVTQLRIMRDQAKQQLADAAPHNREIATDNLARIEERLAAREQADRDFKQRLEQESADAGRAREEREQEADAKLRAELRTAFKAANPGASEADFAAAWPELKQRHQIGRMDRAMATAKASGRYLI